IGKAMLGAAPFNDAFDDVVGNESAVELHVTLPFGSWGAYAARSPQPSGTEACRHEIVMPGCREAAAPGFHEHQSLENGFRVRRCAAPWNDGEIFLTRSARYAGTAARSKAAAIKARV